MALLHASWFTNGRLIICRVAPVAACSPPAAGVGAVLIAGASSESFTSGAGGEQAATGATLQMINTASNQDACKSVTVNLAYAVS